MNKLQLQMGFDTMDFPSVQNVINELVYSDLLPNEFPELNSKQAWIGYIKSVARPCYDYFVENVVNHLCIPIYLATELVNPMIFQRVTRDNGSI